jgi:hypothetical protein
MGVLRCRPYYYWPILLRSRRRGTTTNAGFRIEEIYIINRRVNSVTVDLHLKGKPALSFVLPSVLLDRPRTLRDIPPRKHCVILLLQGFLVLLGRIVTRQSPRSLHSIVERRSFDL